MTQFSSPISSSLAQTGETIRHAALDRNTKASLEADVKFKQAQHVNDVDAMVDTFDADAQVFSDSEGAGSQGRSLTDDTRETVAETDSQMPNPGVTIDHQGCVRLDVQA